MINAPDRLKDLLEQTQVTGIDFIYVDSTQLTLDVYFHVPPGALDDPLTDAAGNPNPLIAPEKMRIYHPSGNAADIPVIALSWIPVDGKDVLRLTVAKAGDFTLYKLLIDDSRLDPYYNDITFDIKANCPSDFDCKPPELECPPEGRVDFPVDYMARDFWSYRRALLEFASLRYPHWPDRLEADAGIMLAELMSALADEMAYYQDRVSREAYLESATQRRSLRRHARLVDYKMHDGLGAAAWLTVSVNGTTRVDVPAGTSIAARGESGLRIFFSAGQGLAEQLAAKTYTVDPLINEINPHIWDEDDACLPAGSTTLFVAGHYEFTGGANQGKLILEDRGTGKPKGKWVLLKTHPDNPAQPSRVLLVRLIEVTNAHDPVLNKDITKLVWEPAQATPFELDMTVLKVYGNIIPATAGQTKLSWFIAGNGFSGFTNEEKESIEQLGALQWAVQRTGPEGSLIYMFTLPGSEQQQVVRTGVDPHNSRPEIQLEEMVFDGTTWHSERVWAYIPSFVGIHSAVPGEECFTLDDGAWRRVVGYQRPGNEIIHRDYASNKGVSIRFGDGEFGRIPKEGSLFRVHYRLGNGKWDNVAADTLQWIDAPGLSLSISNPLPADNGSDAETPEELRQLAPEAFRRVTYRAVRPEDYAEAAERLTWVQRAGAAFRWTGSWLSAFVTPDPKGSGVLEEGQHQELVNQLNRFRQAGREAHVSDPQYADLDIEVKICVAPNAYAGEVKERVVQVLSGKKGKLLGTGYFSADHFTFGTPLRSATLEAVIQAVPGVRAVEEVRYRRRGWFDWTLFDAFEYDPEQSSIIRVENDSLHPERGSFKIYTHGGA